ncbi:hypothetical protein ACNKHL_22140 [Shigella flexneri]
MAPGGLEMQHYGEYDYLIVNDDFNVALTDLQTIIRAGTSELQSPGSAT